MSHHHERKLGITEYSGTPGTFTVDATSEGIELWTGTTGTVIEIAPSLAGIFVNVVGGAATATPSTTSGCIFIASGKVKRIRTTSSPVKAIREAGTSAVVSVGVVV